MKIARSTFPAEAPRRSIVDEIEAAFRQHHRTTAINRLKLQLEWVGPADQTVCRPELAVAIRDCLHKAVCRSPRDGEINVFILVKSDTVEVEIADEGPDCISQTAFDRETRSPTNRPRDAKPVQPGSPAQLLPREHDAIEVDSRVAPERDFRNPHLVLDRQRAPEARVAIQPIRCPQGGIAWSIRLMARETMRKVA